jgi:hypothetical protein
MRKIRFYVQGGGGEPTNKETPVNLFLAQHIFHTL